MPKISERIQSRRDSRRRDRVRDGGCGGGVQVIRESPESGVVRYLYKGNDGHLSTSKRAEAFDKIREFCRGPYQVLKEGKTKGRQRVVEGMGGAEVVTEDWWGIRFQCLP